MHWIILVNIFQKISIKTIKGDLFKVDTEPSDTVSGWTPCIFIMNFSSP